MALLPLMAPAVGFADTGTISPTNGPLGTTVTVTVTECEGIALDAVAVGDPQGWYKFADLSGQGITVPATVQIELVGPPDQQGYSREWMPEPGDQLNFYAACHKVPDPGLFPPGTPIPVGPTQVGRITGATFTLLPAELGANQARVGVTKRLPAKQRIGKVAYRSTTPNRCQVKGVRLEPLKPGRCVLKATNAKGKAIKVRIEVLAR